MELKDTSGITLRVGERKVKVKRAVLSENSKYFQALFTGQYSDSKKEELDLTKDIGDIKDLRLLLQFIKDDTVEITNVNIKKVLQLSTFFVIDKLIEKCGKFMKDTLNVSNCLGYYFLAKEHTIKKVEAVTSLMLENRMHDLLIYEDEIKQLKAEEVQHLIEKDFLRFCTKDSVRDFVFKWLDNVDVLDQTHLDVVSATVKYFEEMENVRKCPLETDCPKAGKNLEDILKKHTELGEEMREKFQRVLHGLTVEENKSAEAGEGSESPEGENVLAVFTFSNRKYIKRVSTQRTTRNSSRSKQKEVLFDICVYNTNTKCWYKIETCKMDTYYSRINYKGTIRSIVRAFPPHIYCTMNIAGDYVLLQDDEFDPTKLVIYDMKNDKWSSTKLLALIAEYVEPGTKILDRCTVYWNDSTFIILKLYAKCELRQLPIFASGMLFYCFQICPLADGKLRLLEIFRTDLVPCQLGFLANETLGTMVGTSSVSNEMLILDNTLADLDLAYVVDLTPLKDGTAAGRLLDFKCILDSEHDEDETESIFEHLSVEILEREDRFLVFCSTFGEEVQVKFEYLYKSQRLETVANGLKVKLPVDGKEDGFHSRDRSSRCDFKGSNWMIVEMDEYSSSCKKVTVQESSGDIVVEQHTPPPFMNVISISAKHVSKDFFSKWTPVKNFLESPSEKKVGKSKVKRETSSV
ncbi:uncharacterized protein LOC123525545 [Mercenaria mercenaria]|uniref:uncharacterized protein LOC123525545 n=1 Tax=Mercenaria mercenaria TaxID=6596 RepID=UPI00234E63F3|nr:uncharacterized protein LOC123525545 [Mercenaria mercenaria]XP_045160608.2 uncharacterized protein LOC123525545 [Mercenaria mercenaria]